MAWKNTVAHALSAIATPASNERLQVADDRRELDCGLFAVDRLACAFDRFEVTVKPLAAADIQLLKERAAKLAARLNYLLEPIGLIEVDADRCVVQLRSIPPQKEEDRTTYYELLAQRGGLFTLCRYEAYPGQPRQTIAAEVTREVFLRLAEDFGALVD